MEVSFDSETLKTTLEPKNSSERRLVVAMLKAFRIGGKLRVKSAKGDVVTCKFEPSKKGT